MSGTDAFSPVYEIGRDIEVLEGLVAGVTSVRTEIARLQARETALLAEAARVGIAQESRLSTRASVQAGMPLRSIAAEFAAAMHLSDRTVQANIDDALTLVTEHPALFSSFQAGRVSRAHVNAVMRAGAGLSDPAAKARFDETVTPLAETMAPGRLRKKAEAIAETEQPRTLTERHTDARNERCVTVTDLPDGMAEVWALLPGILAHGLYDRLTRQARALKDAGAGGSVDADSDPDSIAGAGGGFGARRRNVPHPDATSIDPRTIDQIRADLFTDMLLTTTPAVAELAGLPGDGPGGLGAIRATVQVTIPASTLAGTTDTPGDMTGLTLVDPATARLLAGKTPGWDRVFTHPVKGDVLTVDRYRPSEHLKRHLKARDQHCRFPGCRMPVTSSDIDHTIDAQHGGPTTAENLAHLCRRHHSLKHATSWSLRQKSAGILEWTSPTGRVYIDKPPGVAFMPDVSPT